MVVILIIGVLAAIALPALLGQREQGEDASARSNARNAVSLVEVCYIAERVYSACTTSSSPSVLADTGIRNTEVATSAGGFTVIADSDSESQFRIRKNGGDVTRSCEPVDAGGCPTWGRQWLVALKAAPEPPIGKPWGVASAPSFAAARTSSAASR